MQRELWPIFFAAKNANFIDVADFWEERMDVAGSNLHQIPQFILHIRAIINLIRVL